MNGRLLSIVCAAGWLLSTACNAPSQIDGNGGSNKTDRSAPAAVPEEVTEKYWKLLEIRGQEVTVDSSFAREPHFILKREDNRLVGHSGCNSFSGSYILEAGNRIRFSDIVATRMACPNMEVEGRFFEVLNSADNFSQRGDTLVLNRARMAPLARFVAVYMD